MNHGGEDQVMSQLYLQRFEYRGAVSKARIRSSLDNRASNIRKER
jgi:hypothetical protein